jgi:hypothetical protein
MRHIFLLLVMVTGGARAQQERAESNLDLRGTKSLLAIERGPERWELERGMSGDYQLAYVGKDAASKHKLARAKAEDIDQRFSAAFLQVQFELPADPKDCDANWRMVLRGEEYRFCTQNEQKNQVASTLIDELRGLTRP